MASTTIGVKIDDGLRTRLKTAAEAMGRSPHWLIKQSILSVLERIERGDGVDDLLGDSRTDVSLLENTAADQPPDAPFQPFLEFAQNVQPQSVLRAKITSAYRRPEPECLPLLLSEATLPAPVTKAATDLARKLTEALRGKSRSGGVEGLIHEYSLSSQEGVALMCLAEALLRIPDRATRDALIRDKIGVGDWYSHLGHSPSLFVNAATWGLVVTGRLTSTTSEANLSSALTRLIARGGEPVIRKGVDIAMRMMGEQFVTGQTITEALANSRRMEAKGFRYSYDMLGEAAVTAADADRYYREYEQAIHAIGRAADRRGIYEGPGISVKLSALHPRYSRAQQERAMTELLPRLKALAVLARTYDIGLNIDAEEAYRLELSLDLLEQLCFDPDLAGWNGIGFVVQAYQKRAPFVARLHHRSGPPQRPPADDPAGQGRLLGQRDQARPGRRPGRLPRLHPQGPHRRLLHRLCPQTAGGPRRRLPAVRDPQRLYAVGHPRDGGRQLPRRPVRVPMPARHGRAAVRGSRRQGQAEPPLPDLRPRRHPRNPAGLSGPPPAGERRQHLVRQPDRRPQRLRSTS